MGTGIDPEPNVGASFCLGCCPAFEVEWTHLRKVCRRTMDGASILGSTGMLKNFVHRSYNLL